MSYQVCPLCVGSGVHPSEQGPCVVCSGMHVIHTQTGLPPATTQPLTETSAEDSYVEASPYDSLTDDEVLYWSTAEYDYIQEQKEKLKNQGNT